METKSATKKPSFLGSFFEKAKTFNFSGLSKASSDIGSPGLQESPKFKRKSVLLTGTFGPTQYDQTPTRLTEKALVTPRALTSDVIKLDPNEGDADSMVSPETLPDLCFQSDTPLSPISVTNNTQDVARIRLKFDANADVRSITKNENSNPNRQSSAIKPTEEMGVVEEGDSKAASPRSKGSPRHIFDIAENDKEVDSIVSSAYFGKLSLATPSHSMQKSVTGKKDFAKESEAKTSDADTMNEMGTNLSKKVSLTQGLSLRNHKSSFLRFLPGANDTKGDESPAVRTKDLTLTSLVGLSPLKYKSQSKKSIPELSMSMALQQIDKTDGELVKSPTIKSTLEDTIDNVPRSVAIKLALLNIFGLLVFGAITFGLLTVVATVVTVPYDNEDLVLWIGYFFQGFFLGGLAALFFKGAIRIALKEAEENKKKMHLEEKTEKHEKKSGNLDLHILSGVITICTGFSMLGMGKHIPDVLANRMYFILINAGLLLILGTIFTVYFDIKNKIKSKKVHGHKTHGYFAVRVYKNFISDLYTTRGMLNRVESTVTSPDGSRKDIKISMSKINEEGIDKYRHKHSFEIVTTLKIWGSQLIIMIAYIQFLAIIGLIKLYDWIQEHEDGYLETIPLLLAYPVIMYIFAKLVEVVDRKTQVNMQAHGYYMDAAFAAIFYQIVRHSFTDLNSLWVMIGCKAFYKAVVYIVFGVKADFWKVTVVEKIKAKFRKSKETDAHEVPKKRNTVKIVKLFALRFALIEIADIFYGLVSLILALIKQNVNYDIFFDFVDNEHKDNYIKSTWIEIAVDGGLLLLVLLCWSCSKAYKKIQIGGVLKQYFMPYFGDYMYITLVQLISFLCLVHKV